MRMPRVVMAAAISGPCPGVHGIQLDGPERRAIWEAMNRETVNLICAELPGTEKVPGPQGEDLWTLAQEPFARVGREVEVREGLGWVTLPAMHGPELRERIVAAYERLRDSLSPEVRVTLDRTSG